ncbi:MAG TPA: molybdopterin-dependent oxidoreductase [Myxococcales bacterium]|jgi:anaerobic selenocysteine-containing dehydrogenase
MPTLRTTCNRDCPDSCGILATVEDGHIVSHRGDPEHGVTRGFLCARGNEYLKRFSDPSRVLHPLRRTPGGAWERLSWDDALDLAAQQLARARSQSGPLSVAALSYSGLRGWVGRVLKHLFWAHFGGATTTRGGLSVEAIDAAARLDFGSDATHAPEDLANAAGFVVWGKNVAVTRPHVMPFLKQARTRGARLVVIDPVRCPTARQADVFLQLRPGSDAALALAVGRLLLERGGVDEAFAARHVEGLDGYRRLALSQTLAEASRATDLPASAIEALAELYAETHPVATMVGLGPSYWRCGGAAVRHIDAIAALSGNVGRSGGGVQSDIGRATGLDLSAMKGAPQAASRRLLLPRLGEEMLGAKDPALHVAFVMGANPAATAPDTGKVVQALRSLDFVVCVDQFMTATAQQAHLLLPCTTYLEMDDLVTAYGHTWLGATQAVVPPLGEARTDGQILQGLAARLGFGDALAGSPEALIARLLGPLSGAGVHLAALRERPRSLPGAVAVPFADGKFSTPSGKVELVQQAPAAPSPLADGELHLTATKTLHMVNAQALDERLPAEPVARLHPDSLRARGLCDGDLAAIVSSAGRLRARLAADPEVRRDVLLLNPARWRGELQGVNRLREALVTDLGDGAAMHETRVRLEAVES